MGLRPQRQLGNDQVSMQPRSNTAVAFHRSRRVFPRAVIKSQYRITRLVSMNVSTARPDRLLHDDSL